MAGFTHLWQDDTLAIAGTCVDLEITFDNGEKEKVNDAVLKIYTAEAEEHKKAASDVLKANLAQLPHNDAQTPWRGLEGFAHNLEHLGKMDRLSQGINCFEAIDGLYVTFRKIWDEEKKRMDQRRALDRLCEGSVGRPALNKKRRLGLGIEYWAEGRKSRHIESQGEGLDGTQADSARPEDDLDESFASVWTASIDCEAGYPSLRVSREWIADSVFEETDGKNGGSANKHTTPKIAWLEPPPTLASVPDQTNDSTAVDIDEAGIRIPKPPEVRFVANFGPPVLVPLTIASSVLNRQCLSVVLEDSKFTTFDQALRNLAMESSSFDGPGSVTSIRRWNRSVKTFEKGGEALSHHHSHTLHSSPQIWCYPVQSVIFDHPKHLAELLPTLRQYVMLWTLLRSLTTGSEADSRTTAVTAPTNTSDYASSKGNVIKKSNIDPRRVKLNALLQNGASDRSSSGAGTLSDPPGGNPTMPLPIDVTLSLTSTTPSKPKLDLLWPLTTSSRKSSSTSEAAFASVSIEIEPQGEVVVHSATGLPFGESQKGLNSMAKVIGLSEDLGLFVEWVMEKLQDKLR